MNPEMKSSRLIADVGDGIFIGQFEGCDNFGTEFTNTIHITRNSDAERRCKAFGTDNGVQLWWREEEGIDVLGSKICDAVCLARQPGDLLVHCREGVCRSSSMALIAKLSRGCDPWQAIADISRGQWKDREKVSTWNHKTIHGILKWFGVS